MTTFTLSRGLQPVGYDAVMELGRVNRREDLVSVLKLADERGGAVTPEQVCDTLLMGRPPAVGVAIIRRLSEIGLLEPDGRLTTRGQEAAQTGEVYLPERGRYRIWLSQDPILPHPVLSIQPAFEEYLWQERQRANQGSAAGQSMSLPAWFTRMAGAVVSLPAEAGGRVAIYHVEPVGAPVPFLTTPPRLRVDWKLNDRGKPSAEITGDWKVPIPPPEMPFEKVWENLLGPRRADWAPWHDGFALRTRFRDPDLEDHERMGLARDLPIPAPVVPPYGAFEGTTAKSIPIVPHSPTEAQEWAVWMLGTLPNGYLTSSAFSKLQQRVSRTFDGFHLSLPERQELAKQVRSDAEASGTRLPAQYWYLQAPLDLGEGEATRDAHEEQGGED